MLAEQHIMLDLIIAHKQCTVHDHEVSCQNSDIPEELPGLQTAIDR